MKYRRASCKLEHALKHIVVINEEFEDFYSQNEDELDLYCMNHNSKVFDTQTTIETDFEYEKKQTSEYMLRPGRSKKTSLRKISYI